MKANNGNMSDEELIRRCVGGDMEAFGILVDRYKIQLNSFIYRSIQDKHKAEDIFQDTFLRVIKALPKYKHKGKFTGWLYTIANNLIIDNVRKEKYVESDDEADLADNMPSAEDKIVEKEKKEFLETAISRLPFEQRQVVLLRIESNLSFKEISRVLNCPLNTVLSRMHQATKLIRKYIK